MLKRSFSPFALEVFSVMTGFCALSCGRAMVTSARDKAQATKLCNRSPNFISFYILWVNILVEPPYVWEELKHTRTANDELFLSFCPQRYYFFLYVLAARWNSLLKN